jgi:hypothetical protein
MACACIACDRSGGSPRTTDSAVQDTAGASATAGTTGGAGASAGEGAAGTGAGTGAVAGTGAAGSTAGSASIDPTMLEKCPTAAPRPQDGEWAIRGEVITTACQADFPPGHPDDRFVQASIKTTPIENQIYRDLNLSTPKGESFRGFVEDDEALISGPLENYPDKPLDVEIALVFAGDCFTAHVRQTVAASTGACAIETYLVGARQP